MRNGLGKYVVQMHNLVLHSGIATVWKFQDFSVIQILREINFGESRVLKLLFLPFYGTLKFFNLLNFSLQKMKKVHRNQNSGPLNV